MGQIASAVFMFFVLRRQVRLFKLYITPELKVFRKILFLLAVVIFLGNLVPIIIDTLTVISHIHRSTNQVNTVGLLYAVSNTLTATMSALLIWIMYRMAAETLIIVEHDKQEVERKNSKH